MLSTDREQFDVQLALLCQGYGFWVGDRSEAYWKGLAKMSLLEFARCVEFALSEQGPEKIPNVHGIWRIRRELRGQSPQASAPVEVLPPQGKWLTCVNSLFLKYLRKRRLEEDFKGDLHILKRRADCLSLVAFFEGLEAELDPEATEAEMAKRFHVAMTRISMATESPTAKERTHAQA